MKNYVKEYKGFTVPEGATHYNEANILWPKCFIDAKYGRIDKMDGNGWVLSEKTMPITAIELPEAPQEWNGEGLPPAGVECEALFTQTWVTVFVVGNAHEYGLGIENIKTGEIHKVDPEKIKFRPLRTQQEKEREAFVDAARKATNADENDIVATDIFDDMFHAGFTAPKEGDNDK